jgi:REP element-mobilizing transposase RayT
MAYHGCRRLNSLHLPGFDYTSPGAYFITIVTADRRRLFGRIWQGALEPSPTGIMIARAWRFLRRHFANVTPGPFAVMPDHFHGIVIIEPAGRRSGRLGGLFQAVQAFKSISTVAYLRSPARDDLPPWRWKLWQRRYYDTIIRNEPMYRTVERYIHNNPRVAWERLRRRSAAAPPPKRG